MNIDKLLDRLIYGDPIKEITTSGNIAVMDLPFSGVRRVTCKSCGCTYSAHEEESDTCAMCGGEVEDTK